MSKEALMFRSALIVASMMSLGAGYPAPHGSYRTQNFLVQASSPQFARQVGDAAEKFRKDLAVSWLGEELPPWPAPCPIRVQDGPQLGAGGATEYTPTPQGVRDFRMNIQGSQMRILDSVLPHEVTHTILATHFRQPLPRWADEGACTTVEHPSEKARHQQMLREFLMNRRGIPMNLMFQMREYPQDILPLYAQGYSVSRFLIAQGGRRKFVDFVGEVLDGSQWTHAVRRNYGYESLAELQELWLAWVAKGSGNIEAYVKNTPSQPSAGPESPASGALVAQASATSPSVETLPPVKPLNNSALIDSLASNESGGWYVRRRQSVAANEQASLPPPRSFQKKHLRGHQLSRPQPSQSVATQGIPWSAVPNGTMFR